MSSAKTEEIELSLRDAQLVIAREYGFENWMELKKKVEEEMDKATREELVVERKEKQTSSDDEIGRLVLEASGRGMLSKERITRGYSCEVWRVKTVDDQDLMYRANWFANWNGKDGVHFENEKWALQQCEATSIPAPRFLHIEHGLPGYPNRSVIINTYVEGELLKKLIAGGLAKNKSSRQ